MTADLPPTPAEQAEIDRLADRLAALRPEPAPAFSGALGSAVAHEAAHRRVRARPAGLWSLVGTYAVSGAALLALAATQL